MGYNPAIGRWSTRDPIGLDSGDDNFYRYVGNDPTNRTDPTGLEPIPFDVEQEEKQIEVTNQGTVGLAEQIPFKDGTGTVKVFKDVSFKNPKGNTLTGRIEMQFTATVDLPKDTNWLQFAYRTTLDTEGKDSPGSFPVMRQGQKVWIKKGAAGRTIDTLLKPGTRLPCFADVENRNTRKGDRELTLFDKPTYDPTSEKFSNQTWHLDTYLVSEGKVYYHIQWELKAVLKDGKWVPSYENIKGERTNRLPPWARGDQLPGGYLPDENDDPGREITYPNPVPKDNR